MFTKFSKPIIENENITIFRHQQPDGDAVCSQLALKAWIEKNFRNKTVKVVGNDLFDVYPIHDEVDDEFIKSSLAIVLDTATSARVDDQRFKMAKMVMKIDHHIPVEEFGEINITNPKAAATAELLTFLFLDGDVIGYRVNEECAQYLYAGILYDTQSFTTTSTSQWTLNAASELAQTGIDINKISRSVLEKDLSTFEKITKFRQLFKAEDGLGYIILNKDDLAQQNLTVRQAKDMISEFNNIKEVKICLVAAQGENGCYQASIRSKINYPVNEIANKFNGGGHANAVGIKELDEGKLKDLYKELLAYIKRIDNNQ